MLVFTYRGWTQIEYQNKQNDEEILDDRRREGGTNSTLRIKEQGTHLTLHEHDDDDDDMLVFPKLLPYTGRFRALNIRDIQKN